MKKFTLTVLIVLLTLAVLAGCAVAPTQEGMVINGKKLDVTIEENPSTGYTWAYDISDAAVLKYSADKFYDGKGGTDAVGVGGLHTFSFEGLAAGTSTITFVEGQQWDGGETGDTIVVTVTVDGNGNITSAG